MPNSYTSYNYNTSLILTYAGNSNLIFTSTLLKNPSTQETLEPSIPAYFEMRFDKSRFVQAITLIGDSQNSYA